VPDPATDGPRSFVDAFAAGEYDEFFGIPAGDLAAGLARRPSADPNALADALRHQAYDRCDRPAQLEAIERLRDPATRAIVSGQQAGLLLGPMFTLSKAITAIRLAQRESRPERPLVAVFWIASQDHDTAEVDHAWLQGSDERLHRLELPYPPNRPTGRIDWSQAWSEQVLTALREVYGDGSAARDARDLAAAAFERGGTLADVFACTLSALLGEDGLIVLDPMREEAARLFGPVLRRELDDPLQGPLAIREAGEALKARGVRPQLGRAEDATNLFVEDEDGRRSLLRFDGRAFHLDGHPDERISVTDLGRLLDADPARITPAAGLRPVVQDAVLPTAAVVVGPGELRYFAQLRGVYQGHQVPMPLVWPRAHVTVLEPPVARILAKYGLDAERFVADPEGEAVKLSLALHGHAERFEEAERRLRSDTEELLRAVAAIDPTLAGPVRRSEATIQRTLERLRVRAARALARRDSVTSDQFARLRSHLLPDGRPQERVLSPFSFFAKFGVGPVMERLRTIQPQGPQQLTIDP